MTCIIRSKISKELEGTCFRKNKTERLRFNKLKRTMPRQIQLKRSWRKETKILTERLRVNSNRLKTWLKWAKAMPRKLLRKMKQSNRKIREFKS